MTLLSSAAVQVLHDVATRGVAVDAPPGSPARAVLELVGLEHLVAAA